MGRSEAGIDFGPYEDFPPGNRRGRPRLTMMGPGAYARQTCIRMEPISGPTSDWRQPSSTKRCSTRNIRGAMKPGGGFLRKATPCDSGVYGLA